MRRKEKLILYFILFVFIIIFLGSYFQLPQDGITNNEKESILGRAYAIFIKGRKAAPIQAPKQKSEILVSGMFII